MLAPVTRDDNIPLTFVFEDDGLIPNNRLPLLVYQQAIKIGAEHSEKTIEGLFGSHRWGEMWRNGVYDYLHYHATVHEAMGVAQGRARVRFGGDRGSELQISKADAAISACGPATTSWWWAPIRPEAGWKSPGRPLGTMRRP
jgi:uncharacterized protein YjlB